MAVQMWFVDFSTGFPAEDAEKAWASDTVPNITWEPWLWEDKERIHLDDIVSGRWDGYITDWGRAAAAWGKPVFVRWGHEFNGDWYPWAVGKNGQDPALYVKAYRHVHDLVVSAGARNILWVWCPNAASLPPKPWNSALAAYPGDDVVDWVGLDGYDFDGNATFTSLFGRVYSDVVKAVAKPIYIGEMASGRTGEAKAAWLQDMHESLATQFPGIKGLVWFDVKKERDWRLEESAAAQKGAASIFSQPLYRSRPEAVLELAANFDHDLPAIREQAGAQFSVARSTLKAPRRVKDAAGQTDWSKAPALPVKGPSGQTGTLQVLWDEDVLTLRLTENTPQPMKNLQSGADIWNGDNLEFCISTNPNADPARGYFDTTDWQLGFTPGDGTADHPPRTWEWAKLQSEVPGAKVVARPREGGWFLEASVPWSSLGGFQPKAGLSLGFDAAVDMVGADGNRGGQWVWNGNDQFYNSPIQWGVLALTE
jgi:hypothetical protein